MNSEELEKSLRDEFENYLKDVLADFNGEIAGFQAKLSEKLDRQKAEMDELFKDFTTKFESSSHIDPNFTETVSEHLKLARDEGAKITAAAVAESEALRDAEEKAPANFASFRDAISEISSKHSQSEILKSLVHHSSQYTPRGAFFIVKNKHLVGWKLFGSDVEGESEAIKEVYFPLTAKTSLGESVETLATVESSYGLHDEDDIFLEKLGFGKPTNIYAIPLVVRGRGVAVVYADRGESNENVNLDAIEALIRVSGLTVELLASASKAEGSSDLSDGGEVSEPKSTFAAPIPTPVYAEPETISTNEISDNSDAEHGNHYDSMRDDSYSEPTFANTDYSQPNFSEPTFSDIQPDSAHADYSNSFEDVAQEDTFKTQDAGYHDYRTDTSEFQSFEEDSFSSFEPSEPKPAVRNEFSYDSDLESKIKEETEMTGGYSNEAPADFSFKSADTYDANANQFDSNGGATGFDFEKTVPTFTPELDNEFEKTDFRHEPNSVLPNSNDHFSNRDTTDQFSNQSEGSGFGTQTFETNDFESRTNTNAFDSGYDLETNYDSTPTAPPVAAPVPTPQVEAKREPAPAFQPGNRARFGDRNIDLPIEVEEDERKKHNDARRFARLLVSEIKLYNEQKVKEGRESGDLYERLREAIDRSREMYDKRVQPPVIEKFDYFNYELVHSLAEGDESKLGAAYPGASV